MECNNPNGDVDKGEKVRKSSENAAERICMGKTMGRKKKKSRTKGRIVMGIKKKLKIRRRGERKEEEKGMVIGCIRIQEEI